MKIEMTFRPFLGNIAHWYIKEVMILNLYSGRVIREETHPRLWKYNSDMYEN